MQWTKVSVKYAEHVFSDASDSVFRTYIRLMLLITSMEFAPTLAQLSHKLGKRKVDSLLKYLEIKNISLDVIIEKVMEDVNKVITQREQGKIRQQKHRITRDMTVLDKTKIRLDNKERVNNNNITHPPLVFISKEEQKALLGKYEKSDLLAYVEKLNDYGLKFPKKFKEYDNHSAVIRTWMRQDKIRPKGAG